MITMKVKILLSQQGTKNEHGRQLISKVFWPTLK